MAYSDLYDYYRQQASEANTIADFDQIIASAYRDYVSDRLTEKEYGRIYFACIARQNKI